MWNPFLLPWEGGHTHTEYADSQKVTRLDAELVVMKSATKENNKRRADLADLPDTDFVLQGFCFAGSGHIPFSSAADIKPIHFRQRLGAVVS